MKKLLDTRRKLRAGKKERLIDLVIANRHRNATDPRDLFYAYVGLANDVPPDFIRYDLPLASWLVYITFKMIQQSQTLEVIQYTPAGTKLNLSSSMSASQFDMSDRKVPMNGLPSWCPDWTHVLRQSEAMLSNKFRGRFSAGEPSTLQVSLHPPGLLEISGVHCDTVAHVGALSGTFDDRRLWRDLVADNLSLHLVNCSMCGYGLYGPRYDCTTCSYYLSLQWLLPAEV
ncbi:heterokaryon incompatibility protein-domain-containing protein [Apiospora marii]|uniref:Heterokaryon incompatibility protein-domain-containing protein n=1 Tax=Apiospora marii TaxID=335849 RepID=A0ABR1RCM9_9PEZI